MDAEKELKKFVNVLIAEKKYQVEPEVLEQIKEDVLDRAENIINATIVANTPPEKLDELNRILDENGHQAALDEFCSTNIPELQQKIAEALVQFRKTYLGLQ